jgi:glutaredoxin
MRKLLLLSLLPLVALSTFFGQAKAAESLKVYFFSSPGCPHCADEEEFLDGLDDIYPQIDIIHYDVSKKENFDLLSTIGEELNINVSGVPRTFIGETMIVGYLNDETHGNQIKEAVEKCLFEECHDLVSHIQGDACPVPEPPACPEDNDVTPTKLPIFGGSISLKNLSLPAITFLVALLDGFNPCAMWALVFLISLLLGLKNRRRMWILGTAFIATSGLVYFLLMAAWLNLFSLLGFVVWIRIVVGLAALSAGIYSVRDYFRNKEGVCKVSGGARKRRILDWLKAFTTRKNLALSILGICALAVAVNTIELVCSAGLPAIYTQILALADLPLWKYYFYLIFYVLVFMADDLFIFFVAMKTLHFVGIESKYARYSRLIGGVLMLIIGALLLLKPEYLMFG